MSLIKINLCPHKEGKQNKVFTFIDNYFSYVYLVAAALVVLNIILILFYLFASIPYSNLEKKWQKMQPAAEKINSLRAEITQLQQRKNEYSVLLTPQINTAQLLAAIFESMPKNIWLDNLDYANGTLNIKGYAVYWQEGPMVAVDKLIGRLKNNQYISQKFESIKLISSRKVYINDQQVVEFKLGCQRNNG